MNGHNLNAAGETLARVGPIRRDDDSHGDFAGIGFVVYCGAKPIISLGFGTEAEATQASAKLREVLALCKVFEQTR